MGLPVGKVMEIRKRGYIPSLEPPEQEIETAAIAARVEEQIKNEGTIKMPEPVDGKNEPETEEKQEGVEDKIEEAGEVPEEDWVADALKVIHGGSKAELESIIQAGIQRLKHIGTH